MTKRTTDGEQLLIPLPVVILTYAPDFNIPSHVYIGYSSHKTEPYIPKPIRCNHCQRVGHTTKNCRSQQRKCSYCSDNHIYGDCPTRTANQSPKCANCGGHSAAYRQCIYYTNTSTALHIRANEGLTYKEALTKAKQQQQPTAIPTNTTPTYSNTVTQPITQMQNTITQLTEQVSALIQLVNHLLTTLNHLLTAIPDEGVQTIIKQQLDQATNTLSLSTLSTLLTPTINHTLPTTHNEYSTEQDMNAINTTQ